MLEVGIEEVEAYNFCGQNTVYQYIMTHKIPEICLSAERRPG